MTNFNIGKRIQTLRTNSGMKQEELANRIQKGKGTVSNYETGARDPDLDTVVDISKVFDVSTDYLLGITKYANSSDEIEQRFNNLSNAQAVLEGIGKRERIIFDEFFCTAEFQMLMKCFLEYYSLDCRKSYHSEKNIELQNHLKSTMHFVDSEDQNVTTSTDFDLMKAGILYRSSQIIEKLFSKTGEILSSYHRLFAILLVQSLRKYQISLSEHKLRPEYDQLPDEDDEAYQLRLYKSRITQQNFADYWVKYENINNVMNSDPEMQALSEERDRLEKYITTFSAHGYDRIDHFKKTHGID